MWARQSARWHSQPYCTPRGNLDWSGSPLSAFGHPQKDFTKKTDQTGCRLEHCSQSSCNSNRQPCPCRSRTHYSHPNTVRQTAPLTGCFRYPSRYRSSRMCWWCLQAYYTLRGRTLLWSRSPGRGDSGGTDLPPHSKGRRLRRCHNIHVGQRRLTRLANSNRMPPKGSCEKVIEQTRDGGCFVARPFSARGNGTMMRDEMSYAD